MESPNLILEIEGLEQRLRDRERAEEFVVYVEQKIAVREGDFVALLGPSGCGKTTLLTVLGLLRKPTCLDRMKRFCIGIRRDGERAEFDLLQAWRRDARRQIERARRESLGFALQSGELLPALTVRENIAAPLRLNGVAGRACRERVEELLEAFGFRRGGAHGAARVNKLSGGEYQRVSLARAIAHRPRLVFVDEPTAALNRELARGALRQFQELQQQRADRGATVMITHDEQLADEFANVVIRMAPRKGEPAGEVVEIERRDEPTPFSAPAGATTGEER